MRKKNKITEANPKKVKENNLNSLTTERQQKEQKCEIKPENNKKEIKNQMKKKHILDIQTDFSTENKPNDKKMNVSENQIQQKEQECEIKAKCKNLEKQNNCDKNQNIDLQNELPKENQKQCEIKSKYKKTETKNQMKGKQGNW
jgi:hypothetical protein